MSILLDGCNTKTLTKCMKKCLIGTIRECYELFWTNPGSNNPQNNHCIVTYLPSEKTLEIRPTRHPGYCWRIKNELISDILLWSPTYWRASVDRSARTYFHQLCGNTGCSFEDLPGAMDDRDVWRARERGGRERERVREIQAISANWQWWDWLIYCINQSINHLSWITL